MIRQMELYDSVTIPDGREVLDNLNMALLVVEVAKKASECVCVKLCPSSDDLLEALKLFGGSDDL